MLIVPIGQRDLVHALRPWLTYAIIAVNVAMYLAFCTSASNQERVELLRSWRATIEYVRDRPYLRIPIDAVDLMPASLRSRPRADPTVPEWKAALEQKELDRMTTELRDRYDGASDMRLAYIPAVAIWWTVLTSMFLHAGLFHLAGNMFFLFATGPFVESLYGRLLFAMLYFSGGIIATSAFAWRNPGEIVPLVGASGAIAAVMGAYLIHFATTRLEFVALPFARLRFSLPSLVVLPLWFLAQIVSIPMEPGGGVAVTAHVGGFAYGLAFGAIVRIVQRVRLPAKRVVVVTTPAKPGVDDVLRAATSAERAGDRGKAIALYEQALAAEGVNPVPLLVKLANAQRADSDTFSARITLEKAREDPHCSDEWRRRIDSALAAL